MKGSHESSITSDGAHIITKMDYPDMVTLLTEEESGLPLSIYPSSPGNLETERVQELHSRSIEIDAPFCHDLSTTRDAELSSSSRAGYDGAICESSVGATRKRLLDEILEDDSSSYSCKNNFDDSENTSSNLKLLAAKRKRVQSKDENPASNMFPPLLAISSKTIGNIADEIPCDNGSVKQGMALSSKGQNVLDAFPMSPVDISSFDANDTGQAANTSFNSSLQEDLRNEAMSTSNFRSMEGIRTSSKNGAGQSSKFELELKESEVIELSIQKFLTESDDIHDSSSPLKSYELGNPLNQDSDQEKCQDPANISSITEISKLRQYIINGESFTKSQSEALVRDWLQKNKTLFKHVNQIYRDNAKARETLIVEMSNCLINRFQKSSESTEALIEPAELRGIDGSQLPIIKFLRKCDSTYDFNNDVYYPSESAVLEENVMLLYYDAQQFFERYRLNKRVLFQDISQLSGGNKYLVVVLSGLNKLKRSLQAQENQIYKERVQEQLIDSPSASQRPSQIRVERSKKHQALKDLHMTKFDIDQRIQHIDRLWGVKIHTVSSDSEFLRSLPNLVSIIAKQRIDPNIRFMRYCHINVKSCQSQQEVLTKTLHEINRMPDIKANSVVSAYPTFQSMLQDFEKGRLKSDLDGKHLMTEAMEDRLYKLFTCRNASETIQ